jgi:uncharacterized membrane protein
MFTVINVGFLHSAYINAENIYSDGDINGFDLMKIMAVTLSIGWVVLGNILPKCKQNASIGIRTKWTLNSESVWYKTHRFGGKALFASGVISGLLCLFVFSGIVSLCVSLGALAVATVTVVIYSYCVFKRETQE